MGLTRVERAAHTLLVQGEDAMPLLRAECPTVHALSVAVSRVRKAVMQALPAPASGRHARGLSELRRKSSFRRGLSFLRNESSEIVIRRPRDART